MVVKVRKVLRGNSEHLEQNILDILYAAQVEFDRERLKFDKLTSVTSDDIYRVDAKILFIIYRTWSEQSIQRKQELGHMKLLSEFGLVAAVVAGYENARANHYINGGSINRADIMSEALKTRS